MINCILLKDSEGKPVGAISVIRDISERRKYEDLILSLNKQQQTILDASPVMIFYKDKENRLIRVNETLARANGISREQMEGKTCWDIYPREAADHYWQDDKEVMAAGKPKLNIIETMETPGGTMWVQSDKIPYRDPNGEIIGIIGFIQDITERKRAEEKTGTFLQALESAYDGIVITDLTGHVTYINESALKIFGYSREEGLKLNVSQFPENPEDGGKIVKEINSKGQWSGEVICIKKNKEIFPVILSNSLVKDSAGNPIGMMGVFQDITESKKMAESQHNSEERFRSLVTATSQIVWTTNAQGEVEEDIPNYRSFTGQSLAEIMGAGWINALHPEDRERSANVWSEAVRTHSLYEIEYRLRRYDGEYRDMIIKGVPVLENDGRIREWVGTCNDITERKQLDNQLRENKELLQLQIDRMPFGCIIWDSEFRVLTWNPAAEQIFGYTAAEASGKHPYDIIVPKEVQPQVDVIWRRLIEGDTTANTVNPNFTKDGREILCDWHNTPLKRPDGTILGAMSMVQDITERKRTEVELEKHRDHLETLVKEQTVTIRKSEAQFKAIFNEARDGIMLADAESKKFYMCNQAICKMLGYTEEELKRLKVNDIHPEKDLPQVMEAFEKQARGEFKLAENLPIKRKDGSVFYADINTSPINLSGKNYLMGTFRDITERKNAKEALAKAYAELDDKVRERTKALQEKLDELERFRKATVEREFRMKELRDEIERLKAGKEK